MPKKVKKPATLGEALKMPDVEIELLGFHGQVIRSSRGNPSRATVVIPEEWIDDVFRRLLPTKPPDFQYFLVRIPMKYFPPK